VSDDEPISRREFEAFGRLMDERKDATRTALELAQRVQDAKFEQVNNLRAQVTEERGRYVTLDKFEGAVDRHNVAIGGLEGWRANMTGRMWAANIVVIVLTLLINFAGFWVHK